MDTPKNAAEAVGFLTQAAWKNHTHTCKCLVDDPPRAGNEQLCDCGARVHNENVRASLMIIGQAAARRRR